MSGHTPGPWRWSNNFQTEDGRYTWTLLGGESGYGILSCDGEGNSPHGINDEANARLIAVAPDLLDLANDIVSNVILAGTEIGQRAQELIAKATVATP